MADREKMMMAAINACEAAKDFTTACGMDGSAREYFREQALVDLIRCAKGIGYKLVPIETPAEAHAKAIAARVAETPPYDEFDIDGGR